MPQGTPSNESPPKGRGFGRRPPLEVIASPHRCLHGPRFECGDAFSRFQNLSQVRKRWATAVLIRHHYFDDSFQHIYAAAKRWLLAIEVARALTALLPDNEQAWTNYANSLYFTGRTAEARVTAIFSLGRFPENASLHCNLAC